MSRRANTRWVGVAAAIAVGCNVESHATSPGGASLEGTQDRPRAIAVSNSDYVSTNVSIVSFEGRVLAPSIVSSGSAGVGLSAPLSGDVVLPHDRVPSGELVLVDRYPNGVVTWIDPSSARVRAQLSVNTGFAANPHDYLELSPHKAYVTRYFTNGLGGRQAFDEGGDILVVDPSVPSIIGRIGLSGAPATLRPHPERMTRVGSEVVVVLGNLADAFEEAGDGLVVGIDPTSDTVAWQLSLPGISNCMGLDLAPSGKRLAVSCSGLFADGPRQAARSDVVILDVAQRPPTLLNRYAVPSSIGRAPAPSVAFVTDDLLVGVASGNLDLDQSDVAYTIELATGAIAAIAEAPAFSLGDVLCAPEIATCFLAHAGDGTVLSIIRKGGHTMLGNRIVGDAKIGLPPRSLTFL